MMRYFLTALSIEGFRGINNDGDPLVLKFKTDMVNSVHAPNGVGKSSVFEAIHFAIYGTVPRLVPMQDAEDAQNYIINKFHPNQVATVRLTFGNDANAPDVIIEVQRNAAGVRTVTSPSSHSDPEGFLKALREDFTLVDYTRFASFIDASALDRGRSFADLVGLSRYSRLRQNLEGAADTRNLNSDLEISSVKNEVTQHTRALASIEKRVLAAVNEVTGALHTEVDFPAIHAAVIAALAGTQLLAPFAAVKSIQDIDFAGAEAAIENAEQGTERKKLEVATVAIALLSGTAVGTADLDDGKSLVQLAKERDKAVQEVGSPLLKELLEGAQKVIGQDGYPHPAPCPVCDHQSDDPLAARISAKLSLFDKASALNEELATRLEGSLFISRLSELEESKALAVPTKDKRHTQLSTLADERRVDSATLEIAVTRLEELEKQRVAHLEEAEKDEKELQAKLPPSMVQVSKRLGQAKVLSEAIAEHEAATALLAAAQKRYKTLTRWKDFITATSRLFGEAETDLTASRVNQIQTSCEALFKELVRGGPDVKPTLKRSASSQQIDLQLANFFGLSDLSARALLSESYRNAVAAAIFLSAALKHTGAPRFVVLDDITSSFDAGHQFSLMDAIRKMLRYSAVPDGVQFIILSHDTALEKYFDKLNSTSEWHHQKLQGMPPKGRVMVSALEADRLKAQAENYLKAGDADVGASFLRQYTEYKLGQVISKLEVPVPPDYATRGDKRTLSTYLNAIGDAIEVYCKANMCVMEAKQIADVTQTHTPFIVGNFVSHYETGAGTPFSAYALLGVLQSVDEFAECFKHEPVPGAGKVYYKRLDKK